MKHRVFVVFLLAGCLSAFSVLAQLNADEPVTLKRCEILPLAAHQVSLRIDGVEKTRWHFGKDYPRPFFFPLRGPSGTSLTRMGHPGAPNHDHHRSVWLAHHKVNDVDFWSDRTDARIRQKSWLAYQDGDDESLMAVRLGWNDGKGQELMEQGVIAALRPNSAKNSEYGLEIQITMRPGRNRKVVTLGKTNFGFLAVRVAKTLSVHFGDGAITDSEGRKGEKAIFGKRARWMDYSGSVVVGHGRKRRTVVEGITYFDHPSNPRYPTHWHVRSDGWMGASFGMREGLAIQAETPLTLRYLLYVHSGGYDFAKATALHASFAKRSRFELAKSKKPHVQYQVRRLK